MDQFNDFLMSQTPSISLLSFVINLLLTAVLAYCLKRVYIRYGLALSNRQKFSSVFFLLATTTMIIITIVKSSLALSLGLVGALSIVRFRAAIKEPEELAYLFLTIAIGLGFGAGQRLVTIVGFVVVVAVIYFRTSVKNATLESMILLVKSQEQTPPDISKLIDILIGYFPMVKLKRLAEEANNLEASFLVDIESFDSLNEAKKRLMSDYPNLSINFLDDKGLL